MMNDNDKYCKLVKVYAKASGIKTGEALKDLEISSGTFYRISNGVKIVDIVDLKILKDKINSRLDNSWYEYVNSY